MGLGRNSVSFAQTRAEAAAEDQGVQVRGLEGGGVRAL